MWSEIYSYIASHFPAIAFILAFSFLVGWLTYKATKILNRFGKVEEQCNNCKTNTLPDLSSHLTKIDNTLSGIFQSINALAVYLKGKDEKMEVSLFILHSPMRLTDLGYRILKDICGREMIDDNLDMLLSDMAKQDFKSGLDVQNYSTTLILNSFDSGIFTPVKDYMYKNPTYTFKSDEGKELSVTLDLPTVTSILGIYLRDKYFEKYPELKEKSESSEK